MADVTINQLNNGTLITTIDPVNDLLAIYNKAAAQTYPINRNTLLGVSGTPADISTAQIFTNKSISGSSNTLTNIPLTTAVTGVLPVGNGGSGIGTLSGIVKGNGTSPFSAAVAGTDYTSPAGTETLTHKTIDGGSNTLQNIPFAALLSTIFSGQVQSYTNTGSGGGTGYYINLGGIKLLWITTGTVSTSSGNASLNISLPSSFFTSVKAGSATPSNLAVDVAQYANFGTIFPVSSPANINVYITNLTHSTSSAASATMILIGT